MNDYIFESFNKAENGQFRNELKTTDLIILSSRNRRSKKQWIKLAEIIFDNITDKSSRFNRIRTNRTIIMDIIVSLLAHPDKGIIVNEETYLNQTNSSWFSTIINSLQKYGILYILEEYIDESGARHNQALYPTIQLQKIFDALTVQEEKWVLKEEDKIKEIQEEIVKAEEYVVIGKKNFDEMKSEVLKVINMSNQEVTV